MEASRKVTTNLVFAMTSIFQSGLTRSTYQVRTLDHRSYSNLGIVIETVRGEELVIIYHIRVHQLDTATLRTKDQLD